MTDAAAHPLGIAIVPIDVERLQAVCRMLLDSGDITPMGVRMIEKVLNNA